MMRIWCAIGLMGALAAGQAAAEGLPSMFGESPNPLQKWALMRGGEDGSTGGSEADAPEEEGGKSSKRALLLSVLAPGAGQYYMDRKMRAVAFFGVEALLWGLYLSWKGEGNDIEEEFRTVADQNWNPQHYLEWRVLPTSRSSITHALPCSSFVASANPALYIDAVTEAIGGCRETEKQQYYELIGKYYQFGAGWSDLRDGRDKSDDPREVLPAEIDSVENYVSDLRLDTKSAATTATSC